LLAVLFVGSDSFALTPGARQRGLLSSGQFPARRHTALTLLKDNDGGDTSASASSVVDVSSPGLGVKLAEAAGFSGRETEGELTAEEDEALIDRINSEVLAESGVPLEQLINPSKVVNAERDLVILKRQLAVVTDAAEREAIEAKMAKKDKVLAQEKRAVMRGWLKNLFVGQVRSLSSSQVCIV
jgi:hypothetical protein